MKVKYILIGIAVLTMNVVFIGTSQAADSTTEHASHVKHDESILHTGEAEMTHDEWMVAAFGPAKKEINTIGILVYDGVNSMDVIGPRYVLGQLMGASTRLIAVKPGNVTTVMGVELVPDTTIDKVSELDILVIPGGATGTVETSKNTTVLDWIRKIDASSQYTTSVCTGGWILANTGLLKGRKASANWFKAEEILAEADAKFSGERYTVDGKYWTSAGVSAGIDMSLAIINDVRGEKYTQAVMLDMEYNPAPPIVGGTPDKTHPDVYKAMRAMYESMLDSAH